MAKTLVIKCADFSVNKLTTVEFVEDIPCTGITLSQSTANITTYSPVTITATKTPADTTDELFWETSDSSVATVDGGVITPVGLGSCTITATCGEQTATATVTVAIAYIPNWQFTFTGYESSTHVVFYTYPNRSYAMAFGTGAEATTYKLATATAEATPGGSKAIKLPQNTSSIKINITDRSGVKSDAYSGEIRWFKDQPLGSVTYPEQIDYVDTTFFNAATATQLTFSVPEGADSFTFDIRFTSAYDESVTIDSVISARGLGIEFL